MLVIRELCEASNKRNFYGLIAPAALDASTSPPFGTSLNTLRLPQINNNSIMHRAAILCFAFTRIEIDLLAERFASIFFWQA
jgi:hypothetical protein